MQIWMRSFDDYIKMKWKSFRLKNERKFKGHFDCACNFIHLLYQMKIFITNKNITKINFIKTNQQKKRFIENKLMEKLFHQ